MGVKGLWSLLNPVARPVQIESMEGKRLAIDSSIWLYQFQATMRDKDGRVLVNAHVLGFLRRINKLLFHGIKPVFVFDGGAPVLKRATIAERKKKKAGAAVNHAKAAEKLFAAQMRREAVKVAQQQRELQAARDAASAAAALVRYDQDAGEQIPENAVYLEDLEGRPGPSVPRPPPRTTPSTSTEPPLVDPAEERRKKFRKHDPYRLPETVMPTVSTEEKPDARLATEEELKQFIDDVHPEDIDVDSPEFRALPTEVQYEIIGDLRVRSRQQSHRRLADMLRAAPTALDFSMAQIKHLSQRNALTQQLLTVTDMVGKSHLTIPVRIAAERNREYVLVKRGESEGGGWALGIREGSKANPIKVEEEKESDVSDEDDDSDSEAGSSQSGRDSDIKEISPPPRPAPDTVDPDLKEFKRREILEAIVRRYTPKAPAKPSLDVPVKSFGMRRNPKSAPLFEPTEDLLDVVPTENDEALALALQQEELGSDEETADPDLARALALSRQDAEHKSRSPSIPTSFHDYDDEDDVIAEMNHTAEPESHAETQSGDRLDAAIEITDESMDELEEVSMVPSGRSTPVLASHEQTPVEDSDEDDLVEVAPPVNLTPASVKKALVETPKAPIEPVRTTPQAVTKSQQPQQLSTEQTPKLTPAPKPVQSAKPSKPTPAVRPTPSRQASRQASLPHAPVRPSPLARSPSIEPMMPSSDGPLEEVPIPSPAGPSTPPRQARRLDDHLPDFHPETPESKVAKDDEGKKMPEIFRSPHRRSAASLLAFIDPATEEDPLNDLLTEPRQPSRSASVQQIEDEMENDEEDEYDDDSRSIEWSKSPSPRPRHRPPLQPAQSGETIPSEVEEEDAHMNKEDLAAENDDYARFMAQIKNRDLNEVRGEIDDEIRVLNNQNKVAMRDSDEITQAMINQIQTLLRHFGIPYITAPMEAEAQCAKLAELGLVDGIITDDSDVFLFGGTQCFKNIFNDAKYAECFLLADINRELSLSRERLISLAYFLGSDYTIGLPGVGPVVALEILANFPGDNGVWDFKEWWMKVQRGQDAEWDTDTKWKKSFKKRYSSTVFLTADWPNLLVREAYKYPTTDESDEPFHWGFPKLSALRSFLHEELSWSISKVDDELTPIVQRIARRGKTGALNKQGTLDPFFDMSVTAGNYAPRRRTTANVSKRLMAVIKQFREAEAAIRGEKVEGWGEMMNGLDEEDPKGRGTGKRRLEKGKKRAVDESGLEVMPKEDEESLVGDRPHPPDQKEIAAPTKKRKVGSRKGTVSSIAPTEATEGESVSSEIGFEIDEGILPSFEDIGSDKPVKATGKGRGKGRGRGRGRGTRKWQGERWDVIERPD